MVGLRKSFGMLQLWFRFRLRLEDILHLSHGLEVVGHPDPPLATWRLEDALAELADLLVAHEFLPERLEEIADFTILLLLDQGRKVIVQEAVDVRAELKSFLAVAGGVQGLSSGLELLDLLQAMIEGRRRRRLLSLAFGVWHMQ